MTSADSFLPQIEEQLKVLSEIEEKSEDIEKTKGPLCSERLEHAITCGHLLAKAKESVQEEKGKKGQWKPWLVGRFGNRLPLPTAGGW